MHQAYNLVIGLKSPLAKRRNMTLDSMIGGIVYNNIEGENDTPENLGKRAQQCDGLISYYETDGVRIPMSSEAVLSRDYLMQKRMLSRWIGRNYTGTSSTSLDCLNERDQKSARFGVGENSSHDVEYIMATTFPVVDTKTITFFGKFDGERVVSLIKDSLLIGAKRGSGFGQIDLDHVDLIPIDDEPLVGIVHQRKLVRPVPIEFAKRLRADDVIDGAFVKMSGRYENPFNPTVARQFGYEETLIGRPSKTFLDESDFHA